MAASVLRAGMPTIVWNRDPEPTRDLAELGAEVAESAADAAARAAIVVTMVTDTDAVMSIASDQGMLGALAGAIHRHSRAVPSPNRPGSGTPRVRIRLELRSLIHDDVQRRYSMARPELRFVPLLGVLFVVLVVVGFLVAGDTPDHHALGPEIRDGYDNETKHQIAAFLVALGAVPLLFFAGYLRAVLTRLHPSGRLSANVALAGAVVAATGLAVQSLIHAALAEAAQTSEFSDEALQSLNALDGWSFYPFGIGLSTFVLASGVALVRNGHFFAPVLAWAAIVLGVLGLVPIIGFFAAILAVIWVVMISLTLFARSEAVDRLWDDTAQGRPPRTVT